MKNQLDFEKPIFELTSKLEELKKHQRPIRWGQLRRRNQKIGREDCGDRKQIFSNLTAWQRVQLARHPKRPFTLDYLQSTFTDFNELHGDRLYAEDRAVVGGFARLGEQQGDGDRHSKRP